MKKSMLVSALCCMLAVENVSASNQVMASSVPIRSIVASEYADRDEDYEDTQSYDDFTETPEPVTETVSEFTAEAEELDQVTLKWTVRNTCDNNITHFEIYRSTNEGERGELLATLENSHNLYLFALYDEDGEFDDFYEGKYATYTDKAVTLGTTYYYTIRGLINSNGHVSYGAFSDAVSACVTLGTLSVRMEGVDEHTAKISWNEVAGAEYYEIERSKGNQEYFSVIAKISAGNMLSYKDTALVLGNDYYYRVSACCMIENNKVYSAYSPVQKITPVLCAPVIKKAKVKNPTTLVLSFGKVTKAQGYCLYKINDATGKYQLVQKVKGNANTKFTIKNLKNGVAYSYKIAAYATINGKRVYGNLSKKKTKIMDYYGYEMESWYSRYKRIFGNSGKSWYSSAKEASRHMTTIQIKTWDISGKKKVTRTKYLTVNKKIAPTVKKMFSEIYKSKEKFPIHDIGGYNWRGDKSNSEHCIGLAIDINANENYMIQNGKILAGSCWKPGKNPYSIPRDSKLVKIMAKYGFYWGGDWGGKKDYMHFSYFGG